MFPLTSDAFSGLGYQFACEAARQKRRHSVAFRCAYPFFYKSMCEQKQKSCRAYEANIVPISCQGNAIIFAATL